MFDSFSFQGMLLTGSMIGIAIAGGAYVSTADEATFWYAIFITNTAQRYS